MAGLPPSTLAWFRVCYNLRLACVGLLFVIVAMQFGTDPRHKLIEEETRIPNDIYAIPRYSGFALWFPLIIIVTDAFHRKLWDRFFRDNQIFYIAGVQTVASLAYIVLIPFYIQSVESDTVIPWTVFHSSVCFGAVITSVAIAGTIMICCLNKPWKIWLHGHHESDPRGVIKHFIYVAFTRRVSYVEFRSLKLFA
jgi:hypothetical protein